MVNYGEIKRRRGLTYSRAIGENSIEFGRVHADFTTIATAPTGKILVSAWSRIIQATPPFSTGDLNNFVVHGTNWNVRLLTGNTDTASHKYNGNVEVHFEADDFSMGDYAGSNTFDSSDADLLAWWFGAWYIFVDTTNSILHLQQWLIRPDGTVLDSSSNDPSFQDLRDYYTSRHGGDLSAWVPSEPDNIQVGKDNGYLIHARIANVTSVPSHSDIIAISQLTAADTSAWADWQLNYAGSANLTDRSGNGRNLTLNGGGVLHQGLIF